MKPVQTVKFVESKTGRRLAKWIVGAVVGIVLLTIFAITPDQGGAADRHRRGYSWDPFGHHPKKQTWKDWKSGKKKWYPPSGHGSSSTPPSQSQNQRPRPLPFETRPNPWTRGY